MIISITYIKLKSPWKFFKLANYARFILQQMKEDPNCQGHKQKGIWTNHFTMSMWNTEEEMMAFVRSGAHLKAMKISKDIAAELKFKRLNQDHFPTWKEAKQHLHKAYHNKLK